MAHDDRGSRPFHLLQLVHAYPPAVGGVERSTRDLCERLVAERGFEVTVLTTDVFSVQAFRDARQPRMVEGLDEVQNGVRVRRFPVRAGWAAALRPLQSAAYRLRLPGNDLLRTWWSGPISPAMRRAARAEARVDVVCAASFPLNHMRYAFDVPGAPPVVLVGAVHTSDTWAFDRACLLRLVDRSYATVAHTEHERDWLVARGCHAGRIRVIGHGIDAGELRPRSGAFRARHGIAREAFLVGFVGQQGAHKGLDILVGATPELLQRCPDAFVAVGGARTTYSPTLAALVAALPAGARERVLVVDDLDEQEKADLLGDADVFVSPSRAESFGITTLEAWSLGKPVVVGDTPSQREVVEDGVTGLVVAHGDTDALVSALVRLREPGLRRRLGEAGRAAVRERFSRRSVEGRYVELLEQAARAGRSARQA